MKIYSWNMLYTNSDLDRAFDFVKNSVFDVFCLQEVPEEFLQRLKALPHNIAYGIEMDRLDRKSINRNYCVILSPYAIVGQQDFPLPVYPYELRTKLFVRFMHVYGWTFITNRRSTYADVELPYLGRTRIFSLHLTLGNPARRMHEFDTAMTLCSDSIPTIVCGDFNILEKPYLTILNWLLGGSFRDIFAWNSDRRSFEARFKQLRLLNPLRGKRTQTISRSQLDHILVPETMSILDVKVLPDRLGSDHNPIFLECE